MPRPCRGRESFPFDFAHRPFSYSAPSRSHRIQLTLSSSITSALFASCAAHKQPLKTFLFFDFRTLVIKLAYGTFDPSPNSRSGLRKPSRFPFPLLAFCVNPSLVSVCKLSAIGSPPLASSIFLPALSLQPSPRRPVRRNLAEGGSSGEGRSLARNPFIINTSKSVTKQRTLSPSESTLTQKQRGPRRTPNARHQPISAYSPHPKLSSLCGWPQRDLARPPGSRAQAGCQLAVSIPASVPCQLSIVTQVARRRRSDRGYTRPPHKQNDFTAGAPQAGMDCWTVRPERRTVCAGCHR
jgi:hypothetical protein